MAITLSLDISTKNTGYALFKGEELLRIGTITNKNSNWLNRVRNMSNQISTIAGDWKVDFVVVEDSYRGMNVNTLKKLCVTQGLLISHFPSSDIHFVYPTTWKAYYGLNKFKRAESKEQSLTISQVKYNLQLDNDDESDAYLLGRYFIEKVLYGNY